MMRSVVMFGLFLVFGLALTPSSPSQEGSTGAATATAPTPVPVDCAAKGCADEFCHSKYGHHLDAGHLTGFVDLLVGQSFSDLLASAQYDTFSAGRPGFAKMFASLSDRKWAESLEVIKHMYKRGMNLKRNANPADPEAVKYESKNELLAMAKALDSQKEKASAALQIAKHSHDAEITSFIENEFLHKDSETVHNLAGHVNDLKRFAKDEKTLPLAIEIFDSYLLDKY